MALLAQVGVAQIVVGALLGLVLTAAVIYLALTRAPLVFVADKLSVGMFSGADEVGELFAGSDGVDEAGFGDEPGAAPFDDEEDAPTRPGEVRRNPVPGADEDFEEPEGMQEALDEVQENDRDDRGGN